MKIPHSGFPPFDWLSLYVSWFNYISLDKFPIPLFKVLITFFFEELLFVLAAFLPFGPEVLPLFA